MHYITLRSSPLLWSPWFCQSVYNDLAKTQERLKSAFHMPLFKFSLISHIFQSNYSNSYKILAKYYHNLTQDFTQNNTFFFFTLFKKNVISIRHSSKIRRSKIPLKSFQCQLCYSDTAGNAAKQWRCLYPNFAVVQPTLLKILAKMATILKSNTAKPAIKGNGKVIPLQARCGPEGG